MKSTIKKFNLYVGGNGSGKTKRAKQELGCRPFITMQACNITLDDVYSYPRHHGILIEEVNYKPEKDKVLQILYVLKHVALTSINEKDVPTAIMNLCTRKRMGQTDNRQIEIKSIAPNAESIKKYEASIYDINIAYLKNKDRKEVLDLIKYNKPSDIQLISWIQPNIDVRKIAFADSIMRKWSMNYFYEILSYSWSGYHGGRVNFPKRNSYSPVPKICAKLGLKQKDAYLVKKLLQDDNYKQWAISKLDRDECKILGLKKPRKQSIRVTNTKLGDWI
tara:strand:+ start:1060 stop:1890 length:831 start_codon:yes stop_codon:yes gene_type:complete